MLLFTFLREIAREFSKDNATRLAAALTYYTLFSMAPLLVIAIAIVGIVFGPDAARGHIYEQIHDLTGDAGARAIESLIASAAEGSAGFMATAFGSMLLLIGSSQVFNQLNFSLNTIWNVRPKPLGIFKIALRRAFSVALVLFTGIILLASIIVTALLTALVTFFSNLLPTFPVMLQIANFIISFILTTGIFALIFKYIADVSIAWRPALIGAAVSSLLFSAGRYAIGFYLGRTTFTSMYGAAASVIVILLWVYYSSQILFLGAEFTQVYARYCGMPIHPAPHAEFLDVKRTASRKPDAFR